MFRRRAALVLTYVLARRRDVGPDMSHRIRRLPIRHPAVMFIALGKPKRGTQRRPLPRAASVGESNLGGTCLANHPSVTMLEAASENPPRCRFPTYPRQRGATIGRSHAVAF